MLPSPAPSMPYCPSIWGNCWTSPDSSFVASRTPLSLELVPHLACSFSWQGSMTLESLTQSRFYLHSFTQWPLWASMQDTYLASGAFLGCQGRLHNLSFIFDSKVRTMWLTEAAKLWCLMGLELGLLFNYSCISFFFFLKTYLFIYLLCI